jgi:hypothetical protein
MMKHNFKPSVTEKSSKRAEKFNQIGRRKFDAISYGIKIKKPYIKSKPWINAWKGLGVKIGPLADKIMELPVYSAVISVRVKEDCYAEILICFTLQTTSLPWRCESEKSDNQHLLDRDLIFLQEEKKINLFTFLPVYGFAK